MIPVKYRLYQSLNSSRDHPVSLSSPVFGRNNPLTMSEISAPFLCCFLLCFSLVFHDPVMQKTVIFIDVAAYRIQQELLIYFLFRPVVEPSEILILLDVPEMSLCLDRPDLAVQDPFLRLYVCMGFFL